MADRSEAPKNPASLVFGAIAIFLAIIGSGAAYFLWPRGDRLGAIDLRAGTPTLSVDVGSGDKLNFRIDTITVGTIGGGYPWDSSKSRSNKVREELEASKITITFVGNDGVSDSVVSSGLPLDCSLVVEKAGVYTLTAKVAWVPKDVREAILEVRREKAK